MKSTKWLLVFILLLVASVVIVSCAGDDDADDDADDNDSAEQHIPGCPDLSEVPGKYIFCVWAVNQPKGEEAIVWDRTTPAGNYEAGTQITVEAVQKFEYSDFFGWDLDESTDGWISHENPYTFTLEEDTYIYAWYLPQY